MKYLALLSTFLALPVMAAIHSRSVTVDGKQYRVDYDVYDCNTRTGLNCVSFVPATMDGQPHYAAKITVWRKLTGEKDLSLVQVGRDFDGLYTDKGCFEDDPETLVRETLEHENDPPKPVAVIQSTPFDMSTLSGSANGVSISNGSKLIMSGCQTGAVSLDPVVQPDGVVVIRARTCKDGKWVAAKVRIE